MSLLTAGCVPVSETYLEPSAPGGRLGPYRAACGGAPDYITFSPSNFDWIDVRFSAILPSKSISRQLVIKMYINKNIPHEFLLFPSAKAQRERAAQYNAMRDQPIAITAASGTARISWANGGNAALPLTFLDGDNDAILNGWITWTENVPDFTGDWFLLESPALSFDGVWLELPPIRFERSEGIFAAPINC